MKKATGLKAKLIELTISLGKKKLLKEKMSFYEKIINSLVNILVRKKIKKQFGGNLKLEIDPKSHSAWTGGKQKLLDKGRVSKFNKKFQNFRSDKK